VILAGGIFNRETAFLAGLLGADAIQMAQPIWPPGRSLKRAPWRPSISG